MNERLYDSGNSMNNGIGMSVMGFVLGVVVGAGVALLVAPATGEDTRRRIGQKAQQLRDQAGHKISQAKDMVDSLKTDAVNAVDAGRDAFSRSRSGETPSTVGRP